LHNQTTAATIHLVDKLLIFFKKNTHLLILFGILILAAFFRLYAVVDRYEFAADGDLFSWIVKDIVIDKHPRLIGQETSAPGIFIGPLFYYLIVPFFLLNKMDPLGAIIPVTIFGLLTVVSFYFVFTKLYSKPIGLISSLLYAVLLETVQLDRRVVPSTPTNLWMIWYFFTVIMIARGNFKVLPLLGVLIGLIWHIHIALIPSLIAIPVATYFSKKIPAIKSIVYFFVALLLTSIPLIIFEVKNNFVQLLSLINNFGKITPGVATGLYKIQLVLGFTIQNINNLFFSPQNIPFLQNIFFYLLIILSGFWLVLKKYLSYQELLTLYSWILGLTLFFSLSSSPISGYYFFNLYVIFIAIISFLLFSLYKSSRQGKVFAVIILSVIVLKNIHFMIIQDYYHKGYIEKKAIVEYITSDAKEKLYPCFSINYITSPGENVGFRYLFYLKNAHVAVAGRGSPVYNIVIPDEYAKDEIDIKSGHIGVIAPKNIKTKKIIDDSCSGANTNLTDPMFGFVK
jgi:hypothetical protein